MTSTDFAYSVIGTNIEDEMRSSYLDYSMSVIVGRALPSARDGLKPVHRRILYAMFREGLLSNRRYSKCAGVVGEVLKKYHPHGDSAVYDALVRMAQPWNLRYPLVDGQGNFGSVDGDSAAAYRYTECRMTRLAEDLLTDIDKDTVDFTPNFDGTVQEPLVLPTRVPNLLINGASGIAVGMATNIAPHNLREIVDATIAVIENPEITADELLEIVPGPDFPTGGLIYGHGPCIEASKTGRGRVIMRGVAEVEKDDRGDDKAIIITEIPYQVNKSRLVETIANLVRHKKVDGIRDIRDESDRTGMRVVVELKRDAIGQVVLNLLYKHTALQSTFGVINLALVDRRPQVLSLKELLSEFVAHRKEVTIRRCRFELAQAEARAHVLEGYLKALDHIDEIIRIIRASANTEEARNSLISRFEFTHVQAQAILDMRLARLTALEREKLEQELADVNQKIERLRSILSSEALIFEVIKGELGEIRERYGDDRRTKIIAASADLSIEDLIPDEEVAVTLSSLGYVKRTPLREYEAQRRGGKGKRGMSTRDEDFVRDLFVASTHDRLMVFTRLGQVYLLPVYNVPEGGRAARGRPIINLVPMNGEDEVAGVLAIREFDQRSVAMVTRGGKIKRTNLERYKNIRSNGIIACGLEEGDEVLTIGLIDKEGASLLLSTSDGKSIHFLADQAREMGRGARGVRGITLVADDRLVGMEVVDPGIPEPTIDESRRLQEGMALLTLTENGFGKLTPLSEYRKQNRGGIGLIDIKTMGRNGPVVGSALVSSNDEVMIITDGGKLIRTRVGEVSVIGRNTQGVMLIRLDDNEKVVAFQRVGETPESDDAEAAGEAETVDGEAEATAEAPAAEASAADETAGDGDDS
ncbi:MAG: DNA gyrase subunit A [Deltaproteobacteria bacterium]|nr:DNA gyrase subunit A [Deltaproteobacteria bacterium]